MNSGREQGVHYRNAEDPLIVGTESDTDMVLAKLRSKFKIKDVGPVKHLLRMEISYMPSVVCQFYSASTLRRVWLGLK